MYINKSLFVAIIFVLAALLSSSSFSGWLDAVKMANHNYDLAAEIREGAKDDVRAIKNEIAAFFGLLLIGGVKGVIIARSEISGVFLFLLNGIVYIILGEAIRIFCWAAFDAAPSWQWVIPIALAVASFQVVAASRK